MLCPHCQTDNRDDRATCYHCGKDLMILRLIVNRAKVHFNNAVERAEQSLYMEALTELESALELNSKFVEALVLKGTLLARLERTDEAAAAWKAALALDPQLARAHRYLGEAHELSALPPLRSRLRTVIGTAAAISIAAVALLLLVIISSPRPGEMTNLRSGWAALNSGNLAKSREYASHVRDETSRTELLTAIERQVQTRLETVRTLAQENNYPEALASLAELDLMRLPDDLAQLSRQLRETIQRDFAHHLRAEYKKPGRSDLDRRQLAAQLDQFRKYFPGSSEAKQLEAVRDRAANTELDRQLAAIDRSIEEDADAVDVASAIAETAPLARELDRMTDIENKEDLLARRDASRLLARAHAAIDAGDIGEYELTLAALRAMSRPQSEIIEQAQGLRTILLERKQKELLDQLHAALNEKSHRRALEIADGLRRVGIEFDRRTSDQIEGARVALAIESFYALMEMGDQIDRGEIDENQARQIVELVESARGPLPPRLQTRAEENLLYFSAIAQRKLGNEDKAREAINQLRQSHPNSGYLERL